MGGYNYSNQIMENLIPRTNEELFTLIGGVIFIVLIILWLRAALKCI